MPVDSSALSRTEIPSTTSSNSDRTFDFRQHRTGVSVPFSQTLTALDFVAIVTRAASNRSDALRGALDTTFVEDRNRHVAAHGNEVAIGVAQQVAVLELDRTFVRGFKIGAVNHRCPYHQGGRYAWEAACPVSPIDWAAITPTASPMLTGVPRARSRP